MTHLLRHPLCIFVYYRAVRRATTDENRGVAAAVTSAASTLLPIPLGVGAVDFTAPLGFGGTEPRIVALHHDVLPHEAVIDLGLEYFSRQLDGRNLVAA